MSRFAIPAAAFLLAAGLVCGSLIVGLALEPPHDAMRQQPHYDFIGAETPREFLAANLGSVMGKVFGSRIVYAQTTGGAGDNNPIRIKTIVPQWDDMRVSPGSFRTIGAGNDPTAIPWKTTLALVAYQAGDENGFETQFSHRYQELTDTQLHLHWTCHSRCAAELGNTVGWRIDYTAADVEGVFGPVVTADLTDTVRIGTADSHEITASHAIDGSALHISHAVIGRVYRSGTGTWVGTTATESPALLSVDIHYRVNSAGSELERSK